MKATKAKDVPYTGKFWQTIQIRDIGEEKFGEEATVTTAYGKYIFHVFCEHQQRKFWGIAYDLINSQKFPHQNFLVYGT